MVFGPDFVLNLHRFYHKDANKIPSQGNKTISEYIYSDAVLECSFKVLAVYFS